MPRMTVQSLNDMIERPIADNHPCIEKNKLPSTCDFWGISYTNKLKFDFRWIKRANLLKS